MVASKTPRKKRVVRRPPKLRTSPWQTVTRPKPNIMIDTEANPEFRSYEKERSERTPNGRAELLQEEVGRDFEQDIRNEAMVAFSTCQRIRSRLGLQDDEGGVVISTIEVQLFLETEDSGIGNVDSVQEGKEVEQAEHGNDPKVDLVHNLTLIDVGEANSVRDVLNRRRSRRVNMGLLLQEGGVAV